MIIQALSDRKAKQRYTWPGRIPLAVVALVLIAAVGHTGRAMAQDSPVSADDIINALEPTKSQNASGIRTRGIGTRGAARRTLPENEIEVLERLEQSSTAADLDAAVEISEQLDAQSIDLTILFEYNSSELSPAAVPQLIELGKALLALSRSDNLSTFRILLAGHTDAAGSDDYNLRLSKARAQSVERFLIEQFGLEEDVIIAVGYGERQLALPDRPRAAENRRVQVSLL